MIKKRMALTFLNIVGNNASAKNHREKNVENRREPSVATYTADSGKPELTSSDNVFALPFRN